MKVLVTGANGFLGAALAKRLWRNDRVQCVGAVRDLQGVTGHRSNWVSVGNIDADTDWRAAVAGQDVIVHTAARAHIMNDEALDPIWEYRRVNVEGTLNLAQQAADAGVRRFIFISSIKVNGESTLPGAPFTADQTPQPEDAYGISKMEAEQGLWRIAQDTGMDVVVIRPPMIYGPGVKGNFATMSQLVRKGWPLPLASIHNKRSLVALDNLIDLIITCLDHPGAANQVFLVSDGEDLSTTDLLRRVAKAMGRPARLIPVPGKLLTIGARLLGKKTVADRLLGSLQVSLQKSRSVLGWVPPVTVEEGLQRCFKEDHHS